MSARRPVGGRLAGHLSIRGVRRFDADSTSLEIRGGHVVSAAQGVADGDPPVLDGEGLVLIPGLLDLQVNGGFGQDLTNEPGRVWEVGAGLAKGGVTTFLPTIISAPADVHAEALRVLKAGPPKGWRGATALGWHFEGPMISPARKGAHPERYLVSPSSAVVQDWSLRAGVRMVTLAPELRGAHDVIAQLTERNVVVSLGHTEATAAEVVAAVDAGARCLTHLGNAMPAMAAREPGPIGAALSDPRVVAGVIADGVHCDEFFLRAAWSALGPHRLWLVSDTTAALGLPDGPARLGAQDVVVNQGAVRLHDGTLAGSAASLERCLNVLNLATGAAWPEVIRTATATPAALLGDGDRGHLRPGAVGDAVLVDLGSSGLQVTATVVGGHVVFDRRTEIGVV